MVLSECAARRPSVSNALPRASPMVFCTPQKCFVRSRRGSNERSPKFLHVHGPRRVPSAREPGGLLGGRDFVLPVRADAHLLRLELPRDDALHHRRGATVHLTWEGTVCW